MHLIMLELVKLIFKLMSEQAKYVIEQKLGQQIANDLQSLEREFP